MSIATRLDRIEELLAQRAEKANATQGRSSPADTNVSPFAQALSDTGVTRQQVAPGGDSDAAATSTLASARDPRADVMVIVTGVPESRACLS